MSDGSKDRTKADSDGVSSAYRPPKEPVSKFDLPRKEPEEQRHAHPRLRGGVMFGTGLVLLAATQGLRIASGRAVCVVPVLLLYGGWSMLVGQPVDKDGKLASWGMIGAWLSGVLGILVAIVIAVWMG